MAEHVANSGGTKESALERLLPTWHFREKHTLEVPGSEEQVLAAMHATTWEEAPVARMLMALTRADVSAERRIVADFLSGMGEVQPSERTEFLFAAIQAVEDVPRPPGTVAEIIESCSEPGVLKVGMNVRYTGDALSTETRVLATDERSRRKFAPYWYLIRGGSGLTRRSMLRGIRRRLCAETEQGTQTR